MILTKPRKKECVSTCLVDPCEWFSEGINAFLPGCSLAAVAVVVWWPVCWLGLGQKVSPVLGDGEREKRAEMTRVLDFEEQKK